MDNELRIACLTVVREVCRIMIDALMKERLTREDWNKVNKLFAIFAEEIKKEWKEK